MDGIAKTLNKKLNQIKLHILKLQISLEDETVVIQFKRK